MKRSLAVPLLAFLLSACSTQEIYENEFVKDAQVTQTTKAGAILKGLPLPKQQVPVVVYEFPDQTGQFKSNDNFGEYSSAVTKGGLAVLVESLLDASQGNFFMVSERGGLNNLLRERQIIRGMRQEYALPNGAPLPDVQPMLYGGVILEGGIIFYDSNVMTGGAAAGYFGISSSAQYRRDIVTVYLRAIEVQSGRVIVAVNSSKTVFSYGISAGLIRYLAIDRLLEAEGGFTVNEPAQLAVRQAIETAVYSLIMEGVQKEMWSFSDKDAGKRAMDAYLERRDKVSQPTDDAVKEASQDKKKAPEKCDPFTAWMNRHFGADNGPGTVMEKPKPTYVRKPPLDNKTLPTKQQ